LVVLFFIELGLRILYPEKVQAIVEERLRLEQLAYVFDERYLVGLKPNTYKRLPDPGSSRIINWRTNPDGFRGNPLKEHPPVRIIVYGDSNIEAPFSPLEETYPWRLEQYLEGFSDLDLEVINGGVVGSGPDQSVLRFAAHADKYKPDLVVFHIFADNDFGDLIRNRLFGLGPQNELVPSGFRATLDDQLRNARNRLLLVSAARRFLGLRSAPPDVTFDESAENYLRELVAVTAAENAVYQEEGARVFSHFADHYDVDIALHPSDPSSRAKVALMEGVLKKALGTATERGIKLLVIIQPSVIDVTEGNALVEDSCVKHQIHRLNLFPVFLGNQPENLYFNMVDDHWNAAGMDLAARETADYIRTAWPQLLSPAKADAGRPQ
jgi:hypothetical protein